MRELYGDIVSKITDALKRRGQLSAADIADECGLDIRAIHGTMKNMIKNTPTLGKRVRICGYTLKSKAAKPYPRPVFELGSNPDVDKSAFIAGLKRAQKRQRALVRHRRYINISRRVNSVFELARVVRA